LSENENMEDTLPFPTAPIVRLMKKNLESHKLIKKRVKAGMNEWLGKICEGVTKKMNTSPYPTVDFSMFKQAIQPYENLEEMEREKERIVVSLEKIKQDCDSLIRDIDRKSKID